MINVTATNLGRVMQCNGSRIMAPSYPPDPDTTARDQGNAADWVAQVLHDGTHSIEDIADRKAPNGVYVTPEMVDHVTGYLAMLQAGEMQPITSFGNDKWNVSSRADHISASGTTLTVVDLKYGHRFVEPEMNWTLIAHAIGYSLKHQMQPSTINLTIYQPRALHPDGICRTWTLNWIRLCELYAQIDTTLSNLTDKLVTGPMCGTCDALATCPAARAADMNSIDAVEQVAFDDAVSDRELAYMLDTLETASAQLDNRLNALKELAMHRLQGGAIVPGRALEHQYANRRWIGGLDPKLTAVLFGKDLSKPGLVTPAEAERRGVHKDIVALYTERPLTGKKLIRRDASKHATKLLGAK